MHYVRLAPLTGALALATALGFAGVAQATVGTLHLSWGSCSPGPINQTIAPGQTGTRLVAWLTGQSDPVKSYDVWLIYGDAHNQVPDAWRFDAAGCQAGALGLDFVPPGALSKACPSLVLASGPNSILSSGGGATFPDPSLGFPTTEMRIFTIVNFTQPSTPSASQTYFLVDMVFDASMAVNGPSSPADGTCGGLEDGICFQVIHSRFLPPNSTTDVSFVIPPGTSVSINAPEGCLVVPVKPATWGAIKSQYRI